MSTQKKLKDYINKSVRKIKNRKGYGVHSPFAYSIITEVIEEKLPYYAYQSMTRVYPKSGGAIPLKVAMLLFRLSNRFRARRILEIGCDSGYSILPTLLVDSRNEVISVAGTDQRRQAERHLSFFSGTKERVSYIESISQLPEDYMADMIIVNGAPDGMAPAAFVDLILQHVHDRSILFVRGIQPGHQLETYWDEVCECDQIEVTMDLYDYGLAIRLPRFFKQHYVVSF